MSVPVTVVARKNPAKQNEPEKFYAMAQAAALVAADNGAMVLQVSITSEQILRNIKNTIHSRVLMQATNHGKSC